MLTAGHLWQILTMFPRRAENHRRSRRKKDDKEAYAFKGHILVLFFSIEQEGPDALSMD